jgi:uncharacterized protein (TIGR02680 family)
MVSSSDLTSSLAGILAGDPPTPSRDRFQPLRLGLLGIWQYAEQQFSFHDGRLILHGRNGSGKTKVLEVTSPFLLDANLATRRLDPFGTAGRSMRDNLLYDGRNHQIGYVWCEYGRLTEDGIPEYRTLGAGLRAQSSKAGAPEPWYFYTQRRIGVDVELYNAARNPLNDHDLTAALEEGAVFDTADAYRRAVAEDLFGLTPDRFRSLVELLVKLRRPKLSENFGVEALTSLLSDSLPPVDGDLIDEFARRFDELAREQNDLSRLLSAGRAIDEFLDSYLAYGRCVVRHTAVEVGDAVKRYQEAAREEQAAADRLDAATSAVTEMDAQIATLDQAIAPHAAIVRALERRPEVEKHEVVSRLLQEATDAESESLKAEKRHADAAKDLASALADLERVTEDLGAAEDLQQTASKRAEEQAALSGLADEHHGQMERVMADPSAARLGLEAVIDARSAAVGHIKRMLATAGTVQRKFDGLQRARDECAGRHSHLAEETKAAEDDVAALIDATSIDLTAWAGRCRECRFSDVELLELLGAVQLSGMATGPSLASLVGRRMAEAETGLLTLQADLAAQRERTSGERRKLALERERLATVQNPFLPRPEVFRRDRRFDNRSGAALWALLDFQPDVSADLRAHIEAALVGAGLLDAWVTPDGSALAAGTLDTVILAGSQPTTGDRTLGSVIAPAAHDSVPAAVVARVIESIGFLNVFDANREGVWISADGGWAIGGLRGQTSAATAKHIGVEAREEARRQALEELDEQAAGLDQALDQFREQEESLQTRLKLLELERSDRPDDQPIRSAQARVDALAPIVADLFAELERADRMLEPCKTELAEALAGLHDYAREHSIDPDELSLDALNAALSSYRDSIAELVPLIKAANSLQSQAARFGIPAKRSRERAREFEEQFRIAAQHAAELRAESQIRHDLLGADVQEALVELASARGQLAELTGQRTEAVETSVARSTEQTEARIATIATKAERETHERTRTGNIAAFQQLKKLGFLSLVGAAAADASADATANVTSDAQRAAHALRGEDRSEGARDRARNTADEGFRKLQADIDGPDWRPWGNNYGDLFVVRITHNGQDYDVAQARKIVTDEVETRRNYIGVEERRLFSDVLLGRLGEHLRQRRVEATELIKRMNILLGGWCRSLVVRGGWPVLAVVGRLPDRCGPIDVSPGIGGAVASGR